MNDQYLDYLRNKIETSLRSALLESYQSVQHLPELAHGMAVMGAAGIYCQSFKDNYLILKAEIEKSNQSIGITEKEYNDIVDEITTKVLGEFINLPPTIDSEDDVSDYI